jgi:hypothetical protein
MVDKMAIPIDPYEVYVEVQSLLKSAVVVNDACVRGKLDMHFFFPAVMLSALALEIALKCLYCMRTGDTKDGHSIKSLYASLPLADQDVIRQRFESTYLMANPKIRAAIIAEVGPLLPDGFDEAIDRCDGLFTRSRYRYERPGEFDIPNGLDHLVRAVVAIIIGEHPDWPERVEQAFNAK